MNAIQELLRTGDSFAALEHIQHHGTPPEIAARYESLVLDLYWKAHDLGAVVIIGRAGIIYSLTQSVADNTSPDAAARLRSLAKGLAYNIGSFTWPGWDEPGITPTTAELAAGRDCARLNLRLAIELKKTPDRVSMAHWLLGGAHALAAADFDQAEKEFHLAQAVLPAHSGLNVESLNAGYLALAHLCKNPSDAPAQTQFQQIIARLTAEKNVDAQNHLSQLLTARRIFAPPASA